MSVYRPSRRHTTYIYDFEYDGQRYRDTTHQTTKQAALLVEAKKKLDLIAQAGGLAPATPEETPTFSAWAEVTLDYLTRNGFVTRPAILTRTLRMVLAFWGAEPPIAVGKAAVPRAERAPRPYHNLRLGDPIAHPHWLGDFEEWMAARGIGGSTRNSYLSACSDLYTCALQPQYRATSGISSNPFAGIRRSTPTKRVVALTPAQILTLVGLAGRHIAQALCIAALAPKLRMTSILRLEWDQHLDRALTMITVTDHKTVAKSGEAQHAPVSAQLRAILTNIRADQATDAEYRHDVPSPYVVTYYGYGHARAAKPKPIGSIKTGLRRAVEAAGLAWGVQEGGITFHAIRHSIATILANPKLVGALTERLRADVMGHAELRTTQQYTHLNTSVQEGPHESLSAALPGLQAAATANKRPRKSVGESVGTRSAKSAKTPIKPTAPLYVVPAQKRA